MTYSFTLSTLIAATPAAAFDLSLDVDAHIASTPGSNEQAIAGVTTGTLALGETVTWRAKHFGIWWRMTSRISEHERPSRFVDEQVRGPFAAFHHEHRFEEADGGTLMTDHIDLRAPAGIVGRPIERLVVGPYIERLIRQRNTILKTILENSE